MVLPTAMIPLLIVGYCWLPGELGSQPAQGQKKEDNCEPEADEPYQNEEAVPPSLVLPHDVCLRSTTVTPIPAEVATIRLPASRVDYSSPPREGP